MIFAVGKIVVLLLCAWGVILVLPKIVYKVHNKSLAMEKEVKKNKKKS